MARCTLLLFLVATSAVKMIRPSSGFTSLATTSTPLKRMPRQKTIATVAQPTQDWTSGGTRKESDNSKQTPSFFRQQLTKNVAFAAISTLLLGPFALTFIPYIACLQWGLPVTNKIGNKTSRMSAGHRLGGIGTLILPLILAGWEALLPSPPPVALYGMAVVTSMINLVLGGALITRRVPAYDIPTLRAFATGVLLGFSFLGTSLSFALGANPWYRPIAALFSAVAVYATMFACSDAFQHARLYWRCSKHQKASSGIDDNRASLSQSNGNDKPFWYLPFERPKLHHVFLNNLWRQPTDKALQATVSPANGVVVFTTSMTALFACLGLLQLGYFLSLGGSSAGPAGMAALCKFEAPFCRWSMYQALLAVVANNFGTFAGTLVIQRRVKQQQAGLFNGIGLLIPVLNIVAFFVRYPDQMAKFHRLLILSRPF